MSAFMHWARKSTAIAIAIRMATNANYNAHTELLFFKLNTLKFTDLHELACSKLAFSIIDKVAPAGVADCFQIVEPNESLRNRTLPSLSVPTCKTDAAQRMMSYTIPHIYNNLPFSLKCQDLLFLKESFIFYKMEEYKTFSCPKLNCYSCGFRPWETSHLVHHALPRPLDHHHRPAQCLKSYLSDVKQLFIYLSLPFTISILSICSSSILFLRIQCPRGCPDWVTPALTILTAKHHNDKPISCSLSHTALMHVQPFGFSIKCWTVFIYPPIVEIIIQTRLPYPYINAMYETLMNTYFIHWTRPE